MATVRLVQLTFGFQRLAAELANPFLSVLKLECCRLTSLPLDALRAETDLTYISFACSEPATFPQVHEYHPCLCGDKALRKIPPGLQI